MSAQKHKPGSFLGSLLGLIGFSVVAGLLVSATLTPALAVASSTASSGIGVFDSLPEYARITQQAERNVIYGKQDGQDVPIAQFFSQNREIVQLNQVPPVVQNALISAEDRRFYQHGGVDAPSVIRAAVSQFGIGSDSGASSITMQLVRQQIVMEAFINGDTDTIAQQRDASYARKLKEMKLAIGLERVYTKDEILLAYLNIANFGSNVYGIEAAAQRIFGVSAAQLSIAQSASLIATVKGDSYSLFRESNYERNESRRNWIIGQMAANGYITAEERDAARAIQVDANYVNFQPQNNGCMAAYDSARFFCNYVQRVLAQDQVDGHYIFGATKEDNTRVIDQGGLRIYTSIDLGLNDAVQGVLDRYVPNTETRWNSGGAVIQLEVNTGRILAMAQNKDYSEAQDTPPTATNINFSTDYAYGGSGGFQPGSGYKIFTLAQWIIDGHSVNETINTERRAWKASDFTNSCGPTDAWNPQNNAGLEIARSTVVGVMQKSLNTGIVRMVTDMDLCDIASTANAMGVQPARPDPNTASQTPGGLNTSPASVIGSGNEVSPMSMAEAFQTVANGGVHCQPIAIDRIVGRGGTDVRAPQQTCTQAVSPEVASVMQYTLQEVTKANPLNNPPGSTPVITKTGTNNNVEQTWVNGASPTVATSVWVGNITGRASLERYGFWDVRSQVFRAVMAAAIERHPGGQWMQPDAETLQGDATALPNVAGLDPAAAQAQLEAAGFAVSVGNPVAGTQAAGLIEYSTPGAGALATAGAPVTIYPSDGSQAPQPTTAPSATVPDTTGQSIAEARASYAAAGYDPAALQVSFVESQGNQRCTVTGQTPAAGAAANPGDPIAITVGSRRDGEDPGC